MSKAAGAALGVGELLDLDNLGLLTLGDNHLRDALAVVDDEVFVAEVDEDDAYLAAVVGIDGARTVEDGDALLQRQTAAGTHLRLVARRQLHEETRLHKPSLHRPQRHRPIGQISPQIHSRRLHRLILRQRMVALIDHLDLHIFSVYFKLQNYTFSAT